LIRLQLSINKGALQPLFARCPKVAEGVEELMPEAILRCPLLLGTDVLIAPPAEPVAGLCFWQLALGFAAFVSWGSVSGAVWRQASPGA